MSTARSVVSRDVPVPEGFRPQAYVSLLGPRLAGVANVTIQMGWPGVGYGVVNSRVHDGSAMRHPFKRARTTLTYLAVAMLGTDEDRAAFRKAVNGQHAQVVSAPDEPVQYRAMDPELQKWVAACLYYGWVDSLEKLHGPLPDDEADALYAYGARMGTTLQMPADAWPADRAAFDEYWESALAQVQIDEPVREYLTKLMRLENFPPALRTRRSAQLNQFIATGFLPPVVRDAMQLPWSEADQAKFDQMMRQFGRVERTLPPTVRALPFRMLLWDMRLRRRLGVRLV